MIYQDYASYWQASNGDKNQAYNLDFMMNELIFQDLDPKYYGVSVRCVKNKYNCNVAHCTSCMGENICQACIGNYVAVNGKCQEATVPNSHNNTYMQDFTKDDCAGYKIPLGQDYVLVAQEMIDRRDGKVYEIRKFADGNCWMVNNLSYGGDTTSGSVDGCLKTTFAGTTRDTSTSPSNRFGNGTFGDCRYPYANLNQVDDKRWGYFYDWVAATQDPLAYQGNTYQPSQPVQGICPEGWYLPTGGPTGQLQRLFVSTNSAQTGFWQVGDGWNGVLSGWAGYTGYLNSVNTYGFVWTATAADYNSVYLLRLSQTAVTADSDYYHHKAYGIPVRCLKMP